MDPATDNWRFVWREGLAPLISTPALLALRQALATEDPRLKPGATCLPPPSAYAVGCRVRGACALGFCGWRGEDLETVGEVEEYFAAVCAGCDERLQEAGACRWFLNWFDDEWFPIVQRKLLAEVELVLESRLAVPTAVRQEHQAALEVGNQEPGLGRGDHTVAATSA